jgi:hypothetical protein
MDTEMNMRIAMLASAAVLLFPLTAMAQSGGVAAGATTGAVGGVGGAIVGGIIGDQSPRFRTYVVERKHPSYAYRDDVRVGSTLPSSGVEYYEVPAEYGVMKSYRYTVVNNRTVLVDPATHRIVQVVE